MSTIPSEVGINSPFMAAPEPPPPQRNTCSEICSMDRSEPQLVAYWAAAFCTVIAGPISRQMIRARIVVASVIALT